MNTSSKYIKVTMLSYLSVLVLLGGGVRSHVSQNQQQPKSQQQEPQPQHVLVQQEHVSHLHLPANTSVGSIVKQFPRLEGLTLLPSQDIIKLTYSRAKIWFDYEMMKYLALGIVLWIQTGSV